jgi:PAS domain S-box-containing protein
VGGERALASWLVAQRREIEGALARELGSRRPGPASPEAEGLRRLRSYAVAALVHGADAAPALDGLRLEATAFEPLLRAFSRACAAVAGPDALAVRDALEPVLARFALALRGSEGARRAGGAPVRSSRRAVPAAIDRVADPFLAIETDTGRIADANPAAAALLGTTREGLLGRSAFDFVPETCREALWSELDALAEAGEPRRFTTRVQSGDGRPISLDTRATRWSTRQRTLALLVARPPAV